MGLLSISTWTNLMLVCSNSQATSHSLSSKEGCSDLEEKMCVSVWSTSLPPKRLRFTYSPTTILACLQLKCRIICSKIRIRTTSYFLIKTLFLISMAPSSYVLTIRSLQRAMQFVSESTCSLDSTNITLLTEKHNKLIWSLTLQNKVSSSHTTLCTMKTKCQWR